MDFAPPSGRTRSPWRLVLGGVFVVFGVVAAVYFAFRLREVITLGLVALLLAVGLQGPVTRLHRLGVPRPLGLLIVYVGVVLGLVLAGWLLLPPVFHDLRDLAIQSPTYLQQAQEQLDRFGVKLDTPALEQLEQRVLTEVTSDPGSYVGRAVSILNFTFGVLGGLLTALLVLVLSIFIVTEGPAFRAHLLSLLPPDKQAQWAAITDRIALKIQGWMIGTVLLGLSVGGIIVVSLLLLRMPYAFLLGFIAGLGEFIPMIGPIISAVPAVTIAAFHSWGLFLLVLVLYIVVQQVENYVLVPRIMGSAVDLPGLVVLVAFLLGSELAGVLGAILATPLAAVVQVLWLDWAVPAIRGPDGVGASQRAAGVTEKAERTRAETAAGQT
ncbi:MAG TPA: AI-2E family transporter [Chloroflexota bacterium]|nr:AI-2E family transporter [Chloroflexota bacterium]